MSLTRAPLLTYTKIGPAPRIHYIYTSALLATANSLQRSADSSGMGLLRLGLEQFDRLLANIMSCRKRLEHWSRQARCVPWTRDCRSTPNALAPSIPITSHSRLRARLTRDLIVPTAQPHIKATSS